MPRFTAGDADIGRRAKVARQTVEQLLLLPAANVTGLEKGRGVDGSAPECLRWKYGAGALIFQSGKLAEGSIVSSAPQIAEVASLVGDPARANILCALLGGRALTATELSFAAGVSPQTASGHLGKLFTARLIVQMKQGRHRYYRLAGPQVGQMLESIMNVALTGPPRFQPKSKHDDKLRHARTCYDHIAGVVGVGVAEQMAARDLVILGDEAGEVTPAGMEFLAKLGVDLSGVRGKRRVFCRPCLDWTERRLHIGGAIGAALANRCFELKWIERVRDSRAPTITPAGRRGLMETFKLLV